MRTYIFVILYINKLLIQFNSMNGWIYGYMDGRICGWLIVRFMNILIYGWMDEWMGG